MKPAPVSLIADDREIARFGEASFDAPWFTAPVKDLVRKHRDWLTDVSRFCAEMDAQPEGGFMDAAANEADRTRRLTELRLQDGDLKIFEGLRVSYSDGSVHRIGRTFFEDGTLRWRNAEDLTGEAAEFEPRVTHMRMLRDFFKGIFEDFILYLVVVALTIAAIAAWAAGWFG